MFQPDPDGDAVRLAVVSDIGRSLPSGTQIWLAAGVTDMPRGFDGLASIVQEKLTADPFAGHVFVFRGRRGDLLKLLWWDYPAKGLPEKFEHHQQ